MRTSLIIRIVTPVIVLAGTATGAVAGTLALLQSPADAAASYPARINTGGPAANVRAGASTATRVVKRVGNRSWIGVRCRANGQVVNGFVRRSGTWNQLTSGGYVADANVSWPNAARAPSCSAPRGAARPAAASPPRVSTGGGPANVRNTTSTAGARLRTVGNGTALAVSCLASGQYIRGHVRATSTWDRLSSGGYISDANVAWPSSARPGACGTPGAPSTPPDPVRSNQAFINWIAGPARANQNAYHVPASVTIAQAILESGWGRSDLARRDHNYFGIKCFGSHGPFAIGCRSYPVTECSKSRCYRTTSSFRVYRSMNDSIRDHAYLLATSSRYHAAFHSWRNADAFATAIHRAGYATSPTYSRTLISIMKQYNLYRFNR